jgi:hypothetical protein
MKEEKKEGKGNGETRIGISKAREIKRRNGGFLIK